MRVHVDNLRTDGYDTRSLGFERLALKDATLVAITQSMGGPFLDEFLMTEERFLTMLAQMGYLVGTPLVVGKRPVSPRGQTRAMEDIRPSDCGDECDCEACR